MAADAAIPMETPMIKMISDRPLLVGGVARTEFETDEQHARELEAAGLATRDPDGAAPSSSVAAADAQTESPAVAQPSSASKSIEAAAKMKKAK